MLTAYLRRLILHYLANAASRIRHRAPEAAALVKWVLECADHLALTDYAENPRMRERLERHDEVSAWEWERLGKALSREANASRRVRPDRTAQRIRRLGKYMQLAPTDMALLEVLLRYETEPLIESMLDDIFSHRRSLSGHRQFFNVGNLTLAFVLGISSGTLHRRLAVDSPLVRSGLVSVEDDGDFEVLPRLVRLSHAPASRGREAQQLLFDESDAAELEWTDFDHVAAGRDHVEELIRGAISAGERGVNVLIYGPPGTGKTQFCRTLAKQLGITLYSVGEADGEGLEPTRYERLQELRLAQRILGDCRNSLLLFDEMEDLLSADPSTLPRFMGRSRARKRRADGSKVFMNRMLEQTPVPMLWTTNSARQTCPTVLRRMMYALELRQPSPRVRARIWSRQLDRQGVPSAEEDAQALAREFDVTPGVAAGATVAARLIDGGDISTVRHGVHSLSRLLHGEKPPKGVHKLFDPGLIRADTNPIELTNRLAEQGARRFTLCLQGPPGTGKSAFVRHLAERVGLEVVQKRASDLMSMWVGGTEKAIAEAFAKARADEHFLVFDEADSFLADRRFARYSWEISGVNEMLTWMEHHPLPFACTTNYVEHLDPATLRRFDFKIALDYLAPEQAMAAFRTFFKLEPPAEVRSLAALTPGDFAVVRRRAEILGKLGEPESLVAMLRAECDVKPDRPKPIGFSANGGAQEPVTT